MVFCASSKIIKASFKVLPRINAKGAISIICLSISLETVSKSSISFKASNKGLRYGSTFSFKSPGKKPSFSPASTAGLVKIILFTFFKFNVATAAATAKYVFPVPAGPTPKTISFFLIASI